MPLTFPPQTFICKLRWRLSGDPEEIICTLGVRPEGAGARDVLEVARGVYDAWTGAWESNKLSDQWQFVGVDAQEGADGGTGAVGSFDQLINGAEGFATLPQNCTILVRKKSAVAGQENTGRMYLPAGYLGEAQVSATGEIDQDNVNDYQACMTQFFNNLIDDTGIPPLAGPSLHPVIFHNTKKDGSAGAAPTDVTSFVVDPIIATQRQRLRR